MERPARDPAHAAVVTLFEGDLHHGVGALANSLYRCGFQGTIYAGYRGADPPPWASGRMHLDLGGGCRLRFVEVEDERHFPFYKPHFVAKVWEIADFDAIFYFDSDVVLHCPWSYMEAWVRHGVSLCEDLGKVSMADDHPLRCAWGELIRSWGMIPTRSLGRYFNSGFVGIHRSYKGFLSHWLACVDGLYEAGPVGPQGGHLTSRHAHSPIGFPPAVRAIMKLDYLVDQDALNMALMASDEPISGLGPEGMSFRPGSAVMSHAVGSIKPWSKRPVRDLVRAGRVPVAADRRYWDNVSEPLRIFSDPELRWRRTSLGVAQLLSRYIGKY